MSNIEKQEKILSISKKLGECYGEDWIVTSIGEDIELSIILTPSLTHDNLCYMKIFNKQNILESNKCCRISLLKSEYIKQSGDDTKECFTLNKKQKKYLIRYLKTPINPNGIFKDIGIDNNWKQMLFHFNEIRRRNNKELRILSYDLPMPDYELLFL